MGGPGSGRKKGGGKGKVVILISKRRKPKNIDRTIAYNKAVKDLDKAKKLKMGPNKIKAIKVAEENLRRAK